MPIHLPNKVRFNWIPRRGANDRVDTAIRAKCRRVDAINFIDPFSDLGWRERLEAIKANAIGATQQFVAMITGMLMRGDIVRAGFRHNG